MQNTEPIYSYTTQIMDGKGRIITVEKFSYTNPFTDWKATDIYFGDDPREYIRDNEKYIIEKANNRGSYFVRNIQLRAVAHTHGAIQSTIADNYYEYYLVFDWGMIESLIKSNNQISQNDRNVAEVLGVPNYMVSATGLVRVYDPNAWFSKERDVYYDAPKDPRVYH